MSEGTAWVSAFAILAVFIIAGFIAGGSCTRCEMCVKAAAPNVEKCK